VFPLSHVHHNCEHCNHYINEQLFGTITILGLNNVPYLNIVKQAQRKKHVYDTMLDFVLKAICPLLFVNVPTCTKNVFLYNMLWVCVVR
jgi:hypothetical protein